MQIWTILLHKVLMMFSRKYREKYLRETQTKSCVDNILIMRSKNDHPRDVISRWVEKYTKSYDVHPQLVAQCLFNEQNLYLTEVAVKLDPTLRIQAVDQLLDAAERMRVHDDAIGSYSSVTTIDFVASAYQLASQKNGMLTPNLIARMQSVISRAAYIAVHLMPEDYPQMLYLKANGFHFRSE